MRVIRTCMKYQTGTSQDFSLGQWRVGRHRTIQFRGAAACARLKLHQGHSKEHKAYKAGGGGRVGEAAGFSEPVDVIFGI